MLFFLNGMKSSNVGGSLLCPACQSKKVKRVGYNGYEELYVCRGTLTNIRDGRTRPCGQNFRYLPTPMNQDIASEDLIRSPELGLF